MKAALAALCLGTLPGAHPAQLPAPPLRFGINPGVQAGQLGPLPATAKPDVPSKDLAALARLRPPGRQFVVRLTRLFWSDGAAGIARYAALGRRYGRRGYRVELQVRYHPPPGHDGDVAGFARFVRDVVDAVKPNRRVIALQVTNEVNFPLSADSSDGAYRNAEQALIAGVIAAKDEARAVHDRRLKIGFNWFYRSAPGLEESFWSKLRDPAFLGALDWVGLDAYPGTFFPPLDTPGGERDAVINALSVLRGCLMPLAGIPATVPIRVEENGWPTGLGIRTPAQQADVLRTMVQAFSDYRGTYDVTDYRWFDLRDADSSSPNFQQRYGLLTSDYEPKPAFAAYRDEIARLTG